MRAKIFFSRKSFIIVSTVVLFLVAFGIAILLKSNYNVSSQAESNNKVLVQVNTILNNNKEEDKNQTIKPISASGMPNGVNAEISPRLELLSGVLSQTSWMEKRGPKGIGNKYYRELKDFFSKYNKHRAVQIAEQLTKLGFNYDAPPRFILSLGELPELKQNNEYDESLILRAHDKKILEDFRLALIDLSYESNFISFFESHRTELQGYLDDTVKKFDATKIVDWMNGFYGWSADHFYIELAPAMFPGGGYAVHNIMPDGKYIVYEVVRENSISNDKPQFSTGMSLETLALHEWGHAFVNPTLDGNRDLVNKLKLVELYTPVQEIMQKQAYSNVGTFLNEQVLRSAVALAIKDLYGNNDYEKELIVQKNNGFYLTAYTAELLEYYRKNRDKYKTFKEFAPYLLEQYHNDQVQLTDLINK